MKAKGHQPSLFEDGTDVSMILDVGNALELFAYVERACGPMADPGAVKVCSDLWLAAHALLRSRLERHGGSYARGHGYEAILKGGHFRTSKIEG